MNITIKTVILFVLTFSLLLAGCSSGQLAGATVTSTPTIASTSTFTRTATVTQTVTPTMTPVPTEDFSVSLERAKQIVPETVTIKGDYGYNEKGGVCAIYDEETRDWIAIPFSDDYMVNIQYVPGIGEISMNWYVNKVNRYGLPGEGAIKVFDASGKLLYSVALSVDALSKVTDPSSPMFDEWQVAEVPIVIFSSNGLVLSNGKGSYKNPPEKPHTLDDIEKELSFIIYMSSVSEENKSQYTPPDDIDRYTGANVNVSTIPKLSRGDVITTDFFKKGVEPKSINSRDLMDKMGLDPAIANTEGYTEFIEDGEVAHLKVNDDGIAMVYPSKVAVIVDKLNK